MPLLVCTIKLRKSLLTQPDAVNPRIHGLDAYRAVLMTAGIWIHAAIPYLERPTDDGLAAVATDLLFHLIMDWIHLFRMPAFFILSGFFSAMLLVRRGQRALFVHRFKRIGIPFVLFVCLMNMLFSVMDGIDGQLMYGAQNTPQAFLWSLLEVDFWPESTIHLWFLYLLLYINLIAIGLHWVCQKIPLPWTTLKARVKWVLEVPALSVLLYLLIDLVWRFGFQWNSIPTTNAWLPDVSILTYYLGCFGLGWVIYRCDVDLHRLTGGWVTNVVLWLVVTPLLLLRWGLYESLEPLLHQNLWTLDWTSMLGVSVLIVSSSVGMVTITRHTAGFFLRFFHRDSGFWRYISDAAYWIYLIHLPLAIFIPEVLMDVPIPRLLQYGLTLCLVTAFSLLSYDAFVRNRWLGVLLNGRRYPPKAPLVSTLLVIVATMMGGWGLASYQPEPHTLWGWTTSTPAEIVNSDAIYPYPPATEQHEAGRCIRWDHFVFCPTGVPRDDIALECQNIGAHPYVRWSDEDIQYLNQILPKLTTRIVWVPLDEIAVEDEWRWGDGSLATNIPFAPGEPNDWGGIDEDCVWANHDTDPTWIDVPCDDEAAFLCTLNKTHTSD